jgi:hypothetical protein
MARTVNHVITRPGRKHGDADVQIPVAQDLTTVPGIRQRDGELLQPRLSPGDPEHREGR